MRHVIELSEIGEASLRRLAQTVGQSEETMLQALTELVLNGDVHAEPGDAHDLVLTFEGRRLYFDLEEMLEPVRSTRQVMGGDACIRNTRIPIWMLVGYKQAGFSDDRVLSNFPTLTAADLSAAWDFYATHTERVLAERRRHEEAD